STKGASVRSVLNEHTRLTLAAAGGYNPSCGLAFRARAHMPPWRNWHTRQVEGLCPKGRGGSSPLGGTLPVRGRLAQLVRACGLHPQGRGFEPLGAHPASVPRAAAAPPAAARTP